MEKGSSKQKEKEKGQKADKKKRQSTTEPITPEAPLLTMKQTTTPLESDEDETSDKTGRYKTIHPHELMDPGGTTKDKPEEENQDKHSWSEPLRSNKKL